MPDLAELLHQRLAAEPAQVAGAGVIANGWDAELDEQRSLARGGKELLAGIESEERSRTGIGSLKVRYNKVFGFYIEVTHTHRDRVPPDYVRKQTIKNGERYITDQLKQYETEVLGAQEKALALDGNSGPYLQYAYARISGVRNKYDERFAGREFNRDVLVAMMEKPLRKARELGLPLYCGEFGCIDRTPDPIRVAWFKDILAVFDEHDIGWANWDYKGGFGIVNRSGRPDEGFIKVLVDGVR